MTERQKTEMSTEAMSERRRRMRSIAIALSLFFLVALFYAATIIHLGPNALNRPL